MICSASPAAAAGVAAAVVDPWFEPLSAFPARCNAAATKELVALSSGVSRGRIYRHSAAPVAASTAAARSLCCTEGLGSESSDVVSEEPGDDAVLRFRQPNAYCRRPEQEAGRLATSAPVSPRQQRGKFPPPLSSLSRGTEESRCSMLKSYRQNGRFVLKEVSLPLAPAAPFRILRQGGRLRLKLFSASHGNEEDSAKPQESLAISTEKEVPANTVAIPAILAKAPAAVFADITNHLLDARPNKKPEAAKLAEVSSCLSLRLPKTTSSKLEGSSKTEEISAALVAGAPTKLEGVSSQFNARSRKADSAEQEGISAILAESPTKSAEVSSSCLDESRLRKSGSAELEDIPTVQVVAISSSLDARFQRIDDPAQPEPVSVKSEEVSAKLEEPVSSKLEEVPIKPGETNAKLAEVSGDLGSKLQRTSSGNIQQQLLLHNCSSSCSKLRRGRVPNYLHLHHHRFVATT